MTITVDYDDYQGEHAAISVQTLPEAMMLAGLRIAIDSRNVKVLVDGVEISLDGNTDMRAEISVSSIFHDFTLLSTVNSFEEARSLAAFKKENGSTDIRICVDGYPVESVD